MKKIILLLVSVSVLLSGGTDRIHLLDNQVLTGEISHFDRLVAGTSNRVVMKTNDKVLALYTLNDVAQLVHDSVEYTVQSGKLIQQKKSAFTQSENTEGVYLSVGDYLAKAAPLSNQRLSLRQFSNNELISNGTDLGYTRMFEGEYFQLLIPSGSGSTLQPYSDPIWGYTNGTKLYRQREKVLCPITKTGSVWWYSVPRIAVGTAVANLLPQIAAQVAFGALSGVIVAASNKTSASDKGVYVDDVFLFNPENGTEVAIEPSDLLKLVTPYPDLYNSYKNLDENDQFEKLSAFFFKYVRTVKYGESKTTSAQHENLGFE